MKTLKMKDAAGRISRLYPCSSSKPQMWLGLDLAPKMLLDRKTAATLAKHLLRFAESCK
jgi:hypothetical protein